MDQDKIKELYDKSVGFLGAYYLDLGLGRAMDTSIYRKKAIAGLNLTPQSKIIDIACGLGMNFKIIQKYLQGSGKLVGVDISTNCLKYARGKAVKYGWKNVEIINKSIHDYQPEIKFDAVLCTYAMEIIPNYKKTVDKILSILKPNGRFSMLGMKLSSTKPYTLFNPFFRQLYVSGGINHEIFKDLIKYIKSKFKKIEYFEACYFGYDYVLVASK
ncbi:MAG: class I SAM-dependent methyltransferase [Candidatus Helarchaeota archaeon]